MAFSTSRPDSCERSVRLMAFSGLIGAPLIWLIALQTGYVLAYQACDDQSRSWVAVPTAIALAAAAATLVVSFAARRRARHAHEPQPLLAKVGVGLAALMLIVLMASLAAPLLLQPCD
jgi:membrane protein YdbS with pleckstrin-like domain